MKKFLLAIACLVVQTAAAQPFIDIARASFQQWAEESSGDATSRLFGRLAIPIEKGMHVMLPAVTFERYETGGERLYGIAMPLGYIHDAGGNWKAGGWIIPRLSSNLEDVTGNHYQLGAAVLMTRTKSEDFSFKFGAYYNSEFFGFYMIPLAGLEWKINDRWYLGGILPRKLLVEYKLKPGRLHAGALFESVKNSFRTIPDSYIKILDNQLRLFLDAYLLKNVVLSIDAGQSLFREYKVRLPGEEREFELDAGDNPSIRVTLAYRVRLDG